MFAMLFNKKSLFLLLLFHIPTSYSEQLPLQHGIKVSDDIQVNHYWVSEKLDGIRGYWNGKQLFTRQGNLISPPQWFTKDWPHMTFDGELWSKRGDFQNIVSCIKRKKIKEFCWKSIKLMVFDMPKIKGTFSDRIKAMTTVLKPSPSPYLEMLSQQRLETKTELYQKLDEIVNNAGEGIMLHHQDATYIFGRNPKLLKLKKYQDAEAKVIKHFLGKGKYQHMLGALLVETEYGLQFKIGTGFSDNQRKDPPPVGSIITFKYIGKTKRGVPRFASFMRIKQ